MQETITVSGIEAEELKGGNGKYVKKSHHRYKNSETDAKIYFDKTWKLSVHGRVRGDDHDFELLSDCAEQHNRQSGGSTAPSSSLPAGATTWRATKSGATCSAKRVERVIPAWTLVANLLGTLVSVTCWVLAYHLKAETDEDSPMLLRPRTWVLAVGAAFCGSLSTASTFAKELDTLAPDGAESRTALVYASSSILGAQAICWAILLPYSWHLSLSS